MSFRDAGAADSTLDGVAEILRAVLKQPGYQRNPHQVYDSMDGDPLIGALPEGGRPASRRELLRRVSVHRASPSEIPGEVVAFCRANLQQGPGPAAPGLRVLGRVQSLASLANAIADPSSGLSRRHAEALVRDLVAGAGDPAAKLARQKSDLAGKALSRYPMWCYSPADSRSPFLDIGATREEAVTVLGLGYFAYDEPAAELVRWAHALPAPVRAHQPTAWDAGATPGSVYWRPGGSTYRLDREEYGVPEVVHDPITGDDLTGAMEILL